MDRRIDAIAQLVGSGVGERAVQRPQDHPHKHVALVRPHPEPPDRGRRQAGVPGDRQHPDVLDDVRVGPEGLPDPVSDRLLVLAGVDRDGQIAADCWLPGDRPVGGEVVHLAGHPRVGRAQQPDVGHPLAQHQQPVQAQAHRQPAVPGQARAAQHIGMGESAFPELDPVPAVPGVKLPAREGVRMPPRLRPARPAGHQRAEYRVDHLLQVGLTQRPGTDPPQVKLVRRAGVLPVDGIAAVDEAGADQQDVAGGIRRELPQRGRDHRGRVTSQHPRSGDVARVARLPGDVGRIVAEGVVVIRDRNDARAAAPSHEAGGRTGVAASAVESADREVGQLLHGMLTVGRVTQVGDGQITGKPVWGNAGLTGHGCSLDAG